MRGSRSILAATLAWFALSALAPGLLGCGGRPSAPPDDRTARVDEQVRQRWGKPLAELPAVTLQVVSPHNENIQNEFTWAFSLHHALARGERVEIVWRDVGGGGSTIQRYLQNVYSRAETSGIDVLWGGGEYVHATLAAAGVLEPATLQGDVLANVPARIGAVAMYQPADGDGKVLWVGSALSGFGFIYNAGVLEMCGLAPPESWADLGRPGLSDLLTLADPGQSGSAAAAYRMIVVSEPTWPAGWAKLLMILSNAKRFTDSAGSAANAPVLGESAVATCIDFYGIIRVAEAPNELAYVSPAGQTTFSPDPIAILKNPPNPRLAQQFVDFVMSAEGQALWALPVGAESGPARFFLGRQPIRRDVYEIHAGKLGRRIVNPYAAGQALEVSPRMEQVDFGVLRTLVGSAALDNVDAMRAARRRLNELQADPAAADEYQRRLAEFVALPDDIDSVEKMAAIAAALRQDKTRYETATAWRDYFAEKFNRLAK